MWESDFDRAIESTEEMKSFIEHLEIASPLQPRDVFFGGRTDAFKLHAQADEDTDIKYQIYLAWRIRYRHVNTLTETE